MLDRQEDQTLQAPKLLTKLEELYPVARSRKSDKRRGRRPRKHSSRLIWTERELKILSLKWGTIGMVELMGKLPGRSKEAILQQARRSKLGKLTQGVMCVAQAAKVMGVSKKTVMSVWKWAQHWRLIEGKAINLQDIRSTKARKVYYLDPDEVVSAAKAYFNSETLVGFCTETKNSIHITQRYLRNVLPPELLPVRRGTPFRYPKGFIHKTLTDAGYFDPEAEHWTWRQRNLAIARRNGMKRCMERRAAKAAAEAALLQSSE